jgi:hypothetical protein
VELYVQNKRGADSQQATPHSTSHTQLNKPRPTQKAKLHANKLTGLETEKKVAVASNKTSVFHHKADRFLLSSLQAIPCSQEVVSNDPAGCHGHFLHATDNSHAVRGHVVVVH